MITRVEKDFFFFAGVHFEDAYFINSYDITLSLLIETDLPHEHNVALSRIEYFIKDVLANSVFVHKEDVDAIEAYAAAGMKICELPEKPYDQVVAIVLLLKLNAIMEGRMTITDLTIGSALSEGIRYPIVSEIAENADMALGDHWSHKPDQSTMDCQTECTSDNVVKLFHDDHWMDTGLSWKNNFKK